jgi:hypothetical protein
MAVLSLKRRIAVALRDSIKSDAIAALILEVEAAVQAAAADATKAREQALDPARGRHLGGRCRARHR